MLVYILLDTFPANFLCSFTFTFCTVLSYRCSSSVGRNGGAQGLSLGPGCLYVGIVMHEFMHAAGFWHEQSRADRDNYITINHLNIQDGMEYNFEKYSWDKIQTLDVEYDLGKFNYDNKNNTLLAFF